LSSVTARPPPVAMTDAAAKLHNNLISIGSIPYEN
jgi:hypothetical protein